MENDNSVVANKTNHSVIFTRNATKEPKSIQWVLISIVLLFLTLFLVVPLIAIFVKAFEKGAEAYFAAITHPDALAAIKLTLIVVLITLPLNAIFGVVAAWTITKYDFKGKNFLITLIDLPFSVSPVIAGLIFVLLFGLHGTLGPLLQSFDIKVIFSIPGIVIASIFITFPFIARELIPLMQSQGTSEEEASLTLGAGGFKTFWYVTLPNIKWGLLYGVILCSARTIGEFGAVSVVSGHIRGMTNTMPLHIEILYNEYQFSAAFAVASLMSIFAIITLIIKSFIEWKTDFKSTKAS
ncbi:sulfate ABC transporter permease subunit CysW [Peribacillus simplex]|uniref:sulfate ABC transporter permease subunit CysW n=1 Tax=Peribacillus simplex TaxID=1478 RepID=UPI0011DC7FD3|nr:sulfate ABC transporter permease subunit CysW [Peribacillus simplex]MED3909050.1 sulfate ABC transporter permease subunit CysW [Peribacillus simplex]MED3982498.1 sulfate ABC transporter permease subunit CysW [Peribacillus simplex]MED4095831.1 sulfate ABC transporter permease subunit CysW [Peribacillus simplex]CAH0204004.1 Sulfate transport system permease protein CysW [Peribacillus simplex]